MTDISFQLDTKIKELRRNTVGAFWGLVELLRTARREKIWERLDYESWASYLAQPELSFYPRTVDNYITAFNRFEELGETRFRELSRTRAILIAPHLSQENADDLIGKAGSLSWSDLKTEVLLLRGGEEPDETGRPPKPQFHWCDKHQQWSLTKLQLKQVCIH